jgi:hypothetical protein
MQLLVHLRRITHCGCFFPAAISGKMNLVPNRKKAKVPVLHTS